MSGNSDTGSACFYLLNDLTGLKRIGTSRTRDCLLLWKQRCSRHYVLVGGYEEKLKYSLSPVAGERRGILNGPSVLRLPYARKNLSRALPSDTFRLFVQLV
jgi:hypothetical protein